MRQLTPLGDEQPALSLVATPRGRRLRLRTKAVEPDRHRRDRVMQISLDVHPNQARGRLTPLASSRARLGQPAGPMLPMVVVPHGREEVVAT